MGHVTRFPGDALLDPIDATPFATYVDDLAEQLGCLELVAERMGCGESWLRQGAFRRLGLIERSVAVELLEKAGAELWAIYPDECDVTLEDESYCGRCHENVTPINECCPWCDDKLTTAVRVRGYCARCDAMVTPADDQTCWKCGGGLDKAPPYAECACGKCGIVRPRFDPQGRRALYVRGHAPRTLENAGEVPAGPFREWLEERLASLDPISALSRECAIPREVVVDVLRGAIDTVPRERVRRALWTQGRGGTTGKGAPMRPDATSFFDLYPEDKRARTCPGCGKGKAPHAEMCKYCRRKTDAAARRAA